MRGFLVSPHLVVPLLFYFASLSRIRYSHAVRHNARGNIVTKRHGDSVLLHDGRKKVVFFAGPHKSASTSVQEFFYSYAAGWTQANPQGIALKHWRWPRIQDYGYKIFNTFVTEADNVRLQTQVLHGIQTSYEDSKNGIILGTPYFDQVGPDATYDGLNAMLKITNQLEINDPQDVTVVLNYRTPRLRQWMSMWKHSDTAFTKATYEEFLCQSRDNPELRIKRLDMLGAQMNPLLAAAAFLRQGWNVQMLDMGGVEKARKDVMHIIACELLMGQCKDGFLMYAMHDKKINSSPNQNEVYDAFQDAESEKIESLFRYRDCGLRNEIVEATAASGAKFEILYNQSVWASCYDENKQSLYSSLANDTETLYRALLSQLNCPEDPTTRKGGIRGIGSKQNNQGKAMSQALGIEDDYKPLSLGEKSLIFPLCLVLLGVGYVLLIKVKGGSLQKLLCVRCAGDNRGASKYGKKVSSVSTGILERLYPISKLYPEKGKSYWYWGWGRQADPETIVQTPVNGNAGSFFRLLDSPTDPGKSSPAEGYGLWSMLRLAREPTTTHTGAEALAKAQSQDSGDQGHSIWSYWYGKRLAAVPEKDPMILQDDEASEISEGEELVRILDDEDEEEETIQVEANDDKMMEYEATKLEATKSEAVSSIFSYFRTSSAQDKTKAVEDEIAQLAAEMTKKDHPGSSQSSKLFTYFRASTGSPVTDYVDHRTSTEGDFLHVIEDFEEELADGKDEEVVVFGNDDREDAFNVFQDPVLDPVLETKENSEWGDGDTFSQLFDDAKATDANEETVAAPTNLRRGGVNGASKLRLSGRESDDEDDLFKNVSGRDESDMSSAHVTADKTDTPNALVEGVCTDNVSNDCFKIDDDDINGVNDADLLNEALDEAVNEVDDFTLISADSDDDVLVDLEAQAVVEKGEDMEETDSFLTEAQESGNPPYLGEDEESAIHSASRTGGGNAETPQESELPIDPRLSGVPTICKEDDTPQADGWDEGDWIADDENTSYNDRPLPHLDGSYCHPESEEGQTRSPSDDERKSAEEQKYSFVDTSTSNAPADGPVPGLRIYLGNQEVEDPDDNSVQELSVVSIDLSTASTDSDCRDRTDEDISCEEGLGLPGSPAVKSSECVESTSNLPTDADALHENVATENERTSSTRSNLDDTHQQTKEASNGIEIDPKPERNTATPKVEKIDEQDSNPEQTTAPGGEEAAVEKPGPVASGTEVVEKDAALAENAEYDDANEGATEDQGNAHNEDDNEIQLEKPRVESETPSGQSWLWGWKSQQTHDEVGKKSDNQVLIGGAKEDSRGGPDKAISHISEEKDSQVADEAEKVGDNDSSSNSPPSTTAMPRTSWTWTWTSSQQKPGESADEKENKREATSVITEESPPEETSADVVVIKKTGLVLYKDSAEEEKNTGDGRVTDAETAETSDESRKTNKTLDEESQQVEDTAFENGIKEESEKIDEICDDQVETVDTAVSLDISPSVGKSWIFGWTSQQDIVEKKADPEAVAIDSEISAPEQIPVESVVEREGKSADDDVPQVGHNSSDAMDDTQSAEKVEEKREDASVAQGKGWGLSWSSKQTAVSDPTSGGDENELASVTGQVSDQIVDQSAKDTQYAEAKRGEAAKDDTAEESEKQDINETRPRPSKGWIWGWSSQQKTDDQTTNPNTEVQADSLESKKERDDKLLDPTSSSSDKNSNEVERPVVDGDEEFREKTKAILVRLKAADERLEECTSEADANISNEEETDSDALVEPKKEETNTSLNVDNSEQKSVATKQPDQAHDDGSDEEESPAETGDKTKEPKESASSSYWGLLWSKPVEEEKPQDDISRILEEFEKGVESLQNSKVEGEQADANSSNEEKTDSDALVEPQKEETNASLNVDNSEQKSVATKQPDQAHDDGSDEEESPAETGDKIKEPKESASSSYWGLLWSKPVEEEKPQDDISGILEEFEKGVESLQNSKVEGEQADANSSNEEETDSDALVEPQKEETNASLNVDNSEQKSVATKQPDQTHDGGSDEEVSPAEPSEEQEHPEKESEVSENDNDGREHHPSEEHGREEDKFIGQESSSNAKAEQSHEL